MLSSKLTISQKILTIAFLGVMSLILYFILSTMSALSSIKTLEEISEVHFPALRLSDSAFNDLEKIQKQLSDAVSVDDEELLDASKVTHDKILSTFQQIKDLDTSFVSPISAIEDSYSSYFSVAFKVSLELLQGTADFAQLSSRTAKMSKDLEDAQNSLDRFRSDKLTVYRSSITETTSTSKDSITLGIILCVGTTLILFGIAFLINRGLKRNLTKLINSLDDLAQGDGDLTVRLTTRNQDEIGSVVDKFNLFLEKLQKVVGEVVETAKPLTGLSDNLNRVADSVKLTVSNQQQSVEDAKSSMDIMNSSVHFVSDTAKKANKSASDSKHISEQGKTTVDGTVERINQLAVKLGDASTIVSNLKEDSTQVNSILEVIQNIAEQTNLLALNAAIEAARAGDKGRGFAVVADEVRSLASRTQESTTEIQSTIEKLQTASQSAVDIMEQITSSVGSTVDSAAEGGQALQEINQSVSSIGDMNEQMVQAINEQNHVSSKVITNVNDIYDLTDESTKSVDGMLEASQKLNQVAKDLDLITKQFKV